MTFTPTKPSVTPYEGDDEVLRRITSAKTIDEWLEATKLLPPDDDGYDILAALEENRRWSCGCPPVSKNDPSP